MSSGIELLMNNNNYSSKNMSDDNIDNLEFELNEITDNNDEIRMDSPRISEEFNNNFDIGKETINESFNNIGNNMDNDYDSYSSGLKKEDILRRKFEILKKLERLEKRRGIELSKKYSMDSSLMEMEMEYSIHEDDIKKKNAIKVYGNTLIQLIQFIEQINGQFNPIDVDLSGFSEAVEDKIEEYDDIFEELHDKYKDNFRIMPEIKLIYSLVVSGSMIAFTNKMMATSIPGASEIFRDNPDLAAQFKEAAIKTMSNQSSMGKFMNSISGRNGPPEPINTQIEDVEMYNTRGGNNIQRQQQQESMAKSVYLPRQQPIPSNQQNVMRAEMNGPKDISNILSGLKTKTISIDAQVPTTRQQVSPNGSLVSENKQKKSKRRINNSRNTMSLDL
uniref:Uncharacterized protein n=1 Tax=viral metagenome TaxID=1070528 RepID=A0A6C0H5W8_9ZZZZ